MTMKGTRGDTIAIVVRTGPSGSCSSSIGG
jgi:hypothetical protein